ncbi:c-type cytochrome biogenesis protein CcmI [Herminiimonas aquatilis]|uniref:C-type cytochrome biogenesis protein CcmI n=1 Tax=Herminiimonas aquatilis TaxID=345342 RepID=A0ABW2J659_9BURK
MDYLFFGSAAVLTLAVVSMLVPRLWRGTAANSVEPSDVNLAVLRNQMDELERDLASGTLSRAVHEQAKQELQRRVLEEASAKVATSAAASSSKPVATALAILLPIAALSSYLALGNPAAIAPQAQTSSVVTQTDINAMVASLEEKLRRNPDNSPGWAMLGRSYRAFGRHEDAVMAFAKAGSTVDIDPQLLTEYAESLAFSRNGELAGEPTQLLQRALKLDPNHALALVLAGSAAAQRTDYANAIIYWKRLHAQMPPNSEGARSIEESLERVRRAQRDAMKASIRENSR